MALDASKLYQKVADAIIAAIGKGTYPPGERLPSERDLAEKFKVSRPTIREAMIALEIRGMVEVHQGSGVYVVDAPPAEARAPELDIGAFELTEARRLFEGESAALAATTITDEELDKLEALVEQIAANTHNVLSERADRNFHIAIAEATRNSAIANVVEMLWDQRYKSPLCMNMLERAKKAGVEPPVDDHVLILKALRARDPKAARNAMRKHLERVIEAVLTATEMDAVQRARSEIAARRKEIARRTSI